MTNESKPFPFAHRERSVDLTPRNIRISQATIDIIQKQLDMIRGQAVVLGKTALDSHDSNESSLAE